MNLVGTIKDKMLPDGCFIVIVPLDPETHPQRGS